MKKEGSKNSDFDGLLQLIESPKINAGKKLASAEVDLKKTKIENIKDPKKIIRLLKACEDALLKDVVGGKEEIFIKRARLRVMLLKQFKIEQQELLDEHWFKIQKRTQQFAKKMEKDLEIFRKKLSKKV